MSEQLIQTPGVFGENGNFLLERELGAGGMGGVYMGRDKMLDRPVAVKVMLKEFGADAEFVEKFKKEAQSVARLIHPNIAQVYSYGICDGMPYMAMELASGGSLYSIMNANPGTTDVARVIKICQQVAQALQCASDQGCVHGDVKPENILLDANGNAKLVDFGLAAMQKDTSEIWGTPYYISPEKVRKEAIDFRADMYSLGGTLYHALTGVAPFEGDDSIAVIKKRFEGMPKKPSEVRPDLTPAIDALVMKMLASNKEDRFPSFEALLEAFKNVLTTGLTASPASAAPASAPGGARRMTVRGRRAVMMKRTAATSEPANAAPAADEGDEDEESGGNLGLKVAGVIVGVILLIGGVIGGLIWYQVADKKARQAEEQAQIVAGIEKARAAIRDTVTNAQKFADEFDAFAARAIDACEVPTAALAQLLPSEQAGLLKPGPSKELLAAIAATNDAPKAVEAPATPPPAPTNAPAAVVSNAPAKTATAKTAAKTNVAAKAEAKAPAPAPAAAQPPQVVITMNELWDRAYGCQASAVRIRHAVRQVVKKGAEADAVKDQTREAMEKLAELSRSVVDMLDVIKTSKDVENVRKGITFIKSKGENTVKQAEKQMRIEKLRAEREAKKAAAEQAEKERLAKQEAEKAAKIEEETAAAKAKFEAIVAQGCIRQLDWKSALRQLGALKAEFTTAEGQLAVELEIRKINAMKKTQGILVKHMKGFAFKKGKLKGATVLAATESDIQFERGKSKLKLTWQKFFHDYFSNVIEVLNQFVFNGRKNAGLSQRDVAEALAGGSLMLGIICAEDPAASGLAEKLAKESVVQFPDYLKTAQKMFPDIAFEAAKEEE